MDNKTRKEFRALKAYAVVSSVLMIGLLLLAAKPGTNKVKFDEIDVERINIVDKDGTLRLAIANLERSPGVVIGGKYMKSREGKRPGLIFFNDKGDECGGMTWYGTDKDGRIDANGGLMFDQFNQDQSVGITYSQSGERRSSGLMVWDRPLMSPEDTKLMQKLGDLELMPDGPERTSAVKAWRDELLAKGLGGALRVFVGRSRDNEASVVLNDTKSRPRVILSVDAKDRPSLRFLDADGKVVYSVPAEDAK